jgi:hypothetical protein
MKITKEQELEFQQKDECYIYNTKIKLKEKIRDDDLITGLYRGYACNICNINFNYKTLNPSLFL